jgi:hypothetical protein
MATITEFNINANKMIRRLALEFESANKALRELKKNIRALEPSIMDVILEKVNEVYPDILHGVDPATGMLTEKPHPKAGQKVMSATDAANVLATLVTAYQKLDNQKLARFDKVITQLLEHPNLTTQAEIQVIDSKDPETLEKEREVAEIITIELAKRIESGKINKKDVS